MLFRGSRFVLLVVSISQGEPVEEIKGRKSEENNLGSQSLPFLQEDVGRRADRAERHVRSDGVGQPPADGWSCYDPQD